MVFDSYTQLPKEVELLGLIAIFVLFMILVYLGKKKSYEEQQKKDRDIDNSDSDYDTVHVRHNNQPHSSYEITPGGIRSVDLRPKPGVDDSIFLYQYEWR